MKVPCLMLTVVLLLLTVGAIVLGVFLGELDWLIYNREFNTANEVVSRVEAFRIRYSRLPDSLEEVGIEIGDPAVYYRRISADEYCVWFGTSLGESNIYSSRTKKWE